MTPTRAALLASAATAVLVIALILLVWRLQSRPATGQPAQTDEAANPAAANNQAAPRTPTTLYAHNIRLLKGPDFRIYIRWIKGDLLRTQRNVNPSFDDPDSFVLSIQKGIIHANIGDISNYLNTSAPPGMPLKNISIQPNGDQLKLHGTLHKIIPLPIELDGTLAPTADGLVRFHVLKIDVLKIPMKGLLGGFHIKLADLVPSANMNGIQLSENDIIFDTQKLLPPPHIRGQLTSVKVDPPDIEVRYGNTPDNDAELAKWHNFLRLEGGSLDFGKLTMRNVDLTMIDASQDPWFNLDLVNYQAQIVHGTTRMTEQAGLEIFMPDVDDKAPANLSKNISLEWLKDRNRSLPPDISQEVNSPGRK